MKNNAFTIIELLIALALTGAVVGGALVAFKQFSKGRVQQTNSLTTAAELFAPVRLIMHVGRSARSCSIATNSGNTYLRCQLNLDPDANNILAGLTWVRFIVLNGDLLYQRDVSGTGNFSSVATLQTFKNVSAMQLCGDAEMSGGTCGVEPVEISQRYTALGLSNRFFRFRLTATIAREDKASQTVAQQGSFFITTATAFQGAYFTW